MKSKDYSQVEGIKQWINVCLLHIHNKAIIDDRPSLAMTHT